MRVFVDTNILIDYVCARKDFCEIAERLFVSGLCGEHKLIISDLSYVNTFYVGHQYGYSRKIYWKFFEKWKVSVKQPI